MYCCTPKALYNHVRGVSSQPPPVCNIHLNNATATTGQRCQCAHHTPATGEEQREYQVYALATHQLQVERRESHRANQVYALTAHQLQVERREREIEPIKCIAHHTPATGGEERDRANQVYALTTHQLQVERRESHRANQVYALTTHQLQVERREIEPIKCIAHHTPATGGEERES